MYLLCTNSALSPVSPLGGARLAEKSPMKGYENSEVAAVNVIYKGAEIIVIYIRESTRPGTESASNSFTTDLGECYMSVSVGFKESYESYASLGS